MTYLLRNVDAKLWARVKAAAKRRGVTVRALIVALLTAETARKGDA